MECHRLYRTKSGKGENGGGGGRVSVVKCGGAVGGRGGGEAFLDAVASRERFSAEQWRQVLATSLDEEAFGRRLREASRRGRPLGDEEFVEELEKRAGRRLRAKAVGRPKAIKKEAGEQLVLVNGV